jgi:hypothetical protein
MGTNERSGARTSRWTALGAVLIGLWCVGLTDVQRGTRRGSRSIVTPAPAVARLPEPEPEREPAHGAASGAEPKVRERVAEQVQAQRADLEARFREESADAAWATQYSQHLRTLLGAVGIAGDAIRAIECKTTLCRLEVKGAELSALAAVGGALKTQYWVEPTADALHVLIARPPAQEEGI